MIKAEYQHAGAGPVGLKFNAKSRQPAVQLSYDVALSNLWIGLVLFTGGMLWGKFAVIIIHTHRLLIISVSLEFNILIVISSNPNT